MKKLALLFPIVLTACGFNCDEGEGAIVTKTFNQAEFTTFSLDMSADVELIPSDHHAVEITTFTNFFEKIEVETKGGDLEIDIKGCLNFGDETKVKIYFVKLEEVEVQGSGNLKSLGLIKADEFEVAINGSGDADLEIQANEVVAEIFGSGDIAIKGQTKDLELTINGSGNVKASGMNAESTKVNINGSGDAFLGNCNNLKTEVNGSGNVECGNNPDSSPASRNDSI